MRPVLDTGFYLLKGHGDFGIYSETKPYIGALVEFVKITKAGRIQIRTLDGKLFTVDKKDLVRE